MDCELNYMLPHGIKSKTVIYLIGRILSVTDNMQVANQSTILILS